MKHHHHEHAPHVASLSRVFLFSITLNLLFVFVEAGVGWFENSLGLLSDAGHNLGDVFSLVLAWVGFKLSRLQATRRYTYGYKRSTILISLLNAIILLVAVGAIVVESIHTFSHPVAVDGGAVSWTAGVGIVVNGLAAWLLMRERKDDMNVHGAFLHMAADTLVSVGVVVSGMVISLTGWNVVDPIVSLVIAAVILVSTWHLLSESLRLALDAIPEKVDAGSVLASLQSVPGVAGVHHMHIWALSTTEVALTAHLVLDRMEDATLVKETVRHRLEEQGISHATLETEERGTVCSCMTCRCKA